MDQFAQQPVVDEMPVIDDQDARTERRDVVHVVAGEQDGRAESLIVRAHERAHGRLHRHIEADGRLVEKEDPRSMKKRDRELAFHPLAQ